MNFVKFVVGCEGERTEPGSWAVAMVGELCQVRGRVRR